MATASRAQAAAKAPTLQLEPRPTPQPRRTEPTHTTWVKWNTPLQGVGAGGQPDQVGNVGNRTTLRQGLRSWEARHTSAFQGRTGMAQARRLVLETHRHRCAHSTLPLQKQDLRRELVLVRYTKQSGRRLAAWVQGVGPRLLTGLSWWCRGCWSRCTFCPRRTRAPGRAGRRQWGSRRPGGGGRKQGTTGNIVIGLPDVVNIWTVQ